MVKKSNYKYGECYFNITRTYLIFFCVENSHNVDKNYRNNCFDNDNVLPFI